MPLASGTSLGPYEIEAPLGAGGMGEVYKATDTRLDRTWKKNQIVNERRIYDFSGLLIKLGVLKVKPG